MPRRNKRGVTEIGENEQMTLDERKRQWNGNLASRVLEAYYGEKEITECMAVVSRRRLLINYNAEQLYNKGKEYFQDIMDKNRDGISIIPDIEDFCMFACISRQKFMSYRRSEDPQLNDVACNLANAIASCKKQMALQGYINPATFAIDMNNNHDYVQARTELQVSQKVSLQQLENNVADIANRLPME